MIKILIVDDEKPICDLIDLNLSAAGYFCKSVQDGMKAIECIEREKIDLILPVRRTGVRTRQQPHQPD